jgi:hypothetical protein
MPGTTNSATAPLRYAVRTARRAGLTRDLPYGPQDLQYLRDFNRLAATARTAEELYGGMLELYPRRANPGSLWGGAKAAMSSAA